jgi:hypothetical protein
MGFTGGHKNHRRRLGQAPAGVLMLRQLVAATGLLSHKFNLRKK